VVADQGGRDDDTVGEDGDGVVMDVEDGEAAPVLEVALAQSSSPGDGARRQLRRAADVERQLVGHLVG
jgi:hypothetical protein